MPCLQKPSGFSLKHERPISDVAAILAWHVRKERNNKMNWLKNRVLQLQVWRDTHAQDLVEYALAAGMVAVAAVAAMPSLSSTVDNVFTRIGSLINTNVP